MIVADSSFITSPLEIVHELLSKNKIFAKDFFKILDRDNAASVEEIQRHFLENFLTPDNLPSVPQFSSASTGAMVRVAAIIQQDCLEDEYYHPSVLAKDCRINTGLWTRFPHDPNGVLSEEAFERVDYTNLQCRKRALAQCLESNQRFIVAFYNVHGNEEAWEKWRQEALKMNSLHQFYGVFEQCEEVVEGEGHNFPVLHLIHRAEYAPSSTAFTEAENTAKIRDDLLSILGEALDGSRPAAEALLMNLVSRPAMRVNGLVDSLFIGKLTLNISVEEQSNSCAQHLASLLRQLKPFVSGPVIVSNDPEQEAFKTFSTTPIYPRFDPQTGLLSQSALQQPDGCVLIVDETSIVAGEFKDQAVCNLQALIDLIRHQRVNYDFGMQQVSIKADMPIVSVSVKGGSVLPFDLKVSCQSIVPVQLASEDAQSFVSFLEYCRNLNFQIDEEMANFLEQDYVALRKSSPLKPDGNPKMNEQELHRLVNLARLRAISYGEANLSHERWNETKSLYNN